MREALVDAKVGLSQSRAARDAAGAQLERERAELATVRRRGQLAAGINDAETVKLAAEFERRHSERIEVKYSSASTQRSSRRLHSWSARPPRCRRS